MLQNYRAIFANRPFMWLWGGSLVSAFGDRFTEFGLALASRFPELHVLPIGFTGGWKGYFPPAPATS